MEKYIVPVKFFFPFSIAFRNKISQMCMKREGRKRELKEYVKGGERNLGPTTRDPTKL